MISNIINAATQPVVQDQLVKLAVKRIRLEFLRELVEMVGNNSIPRHQLQYACEEHKRRIRKLEESLGFRLT